MVNESITYANAGNQNVISAVFGCVVCTTMGLHTPIAWELRRYASRTRQMRGTIEEGEIGGDQIGAINSSYGKL